MDQPLSRAIELVKEGKRAEAHALLIKILKKDPHNERAWMWFVRALVSDSDRAQALEMCLKYNPQSQMALKGLEQLRGSVPEPVKEHLDDANANETDMEHPSGPIELPDDPEEFRAALEEDEKPKEKLYKRLPWRLIATIGAGILVFLVIVWILSSLIHVLMPPEPTRTKFVFPPTYTLAPTITLTPTSTPTPIATSTEIAPYTAFLFVASDLCTVKAIDSFRVAPVTVTLQIPPVGCVNPRISPDGLKMAFISSDDDADLYIMNVDGSELLKIPTDNYPWDLAWSPDSKRLVYVSALSDDGRVQGVLNFVDADGGSIHTEVYADVSIAYQEIDLSQSLFWSPDGKWVYASAQKNLDDYLYFPYIFRDDGSDYRQLSEKEISPSDWVSWSSTGQQLLYLGYSFELGDFVNEFWNVDPSVETLPGTSFVTVPISAYWERNTLHTLSYLYLELQAKYVLYVDDVIYASIFDEPVLAQWSLDGSQVAFITLPPNEENSDPLQFLEEGRLQVLDIRGRGLVLDIPKVGLVSPVWLGPSWPVMSTSTKRP